MASVIGSAKRSVDNTVDAYLGRVILVLSAICALGFALAGVWIYVVTQYGTMAACFVIAAIFLAISVGVYSMVAASEKAASENIKAVEQQIEETTSVFPFDVSTVVTVLPLVMPMLKSARYLLPFILIAGLVGSYFAPRAAKKDEEQAPAI